jgi:hypothetical protein
MNFSGMEVDVEGFGFEICVLCQKHKYNCRTKPNYIDYKFTGKLELRGGGNAKAYIGRCKKIKLNPMPVGGMFG